MAKKEKPRRKPVEMAPDLFGGQSPTEPVKAKAHKYEKQKDPNENPMVVAHGAHFDPALRCKDCNHLYTKMYVKKRVVCKLRPAEMDSYNHHHKGFVACTLFEVYDPSIDHAIEIK